MKKPRMPDGCMIWDEELFEEEYPFLTKQLKKRECERVILKVKEAINEVLKQELEEIK